MRFHISSHHTPDNCAVHRGDGTPPVTDWRARCKEVGVEFVAGGSCPPMHSGFMLVEADDMAKLQTLMHPVIGYWDVVITPVSAWSLKPWRYRWISHWNGRSASSSATPNLAWNFGLLLLGYQALMISQDG